MTTELKEIIMHLRKGVMFSVRISYKSAHAHPCISGMLVFLLILSKGFPSLFVLLISSSPVLVCTAILLGTLLSYGKPYTPEIVQDDKSEGISSLKVGSIVNDDVMKKDESFTVETHLEANMGVNERAGEDVIGAASNSSSEIEKDGPLVKAHDEGMRMDNTFLSTSLLLQKDDNTLHGGMNVSEEKEVESGFVNKREFVVEDLVELAHKFDADHIVANTDQNELEGLTVQIAKTTSESPFDSSLGSPWHTVDNCDASSCSHSDGAESSSPAASMADIIPKLDELHPLLDSEDRQLTMRTSDNSDAASSGSSEDHESGAGITDDEVENKDTDKESQEREAANEATVPWTADDQKNVMDLGYSEAERNLRLENLIARRRLRKLQRFETQKNLIDLDSLYPYSIPFISAPRQNPFDLPYDSYCDVNLPPIPGSAPSVLQPRHNPFDLPGGQVEELSTLSTEYLSHHDFVSAAQRGMLSQRLENSMVGPTFSGDFNPERKQSTLNQDFVSQRADSDVTGFTAFERQLPPKSDPKVCTIPGFGSSHYTGHEELTEPEIHQGSVMLSHIDQDRRSVEAADSFDNEQERNRMDVEPDHVIDFITSIDIKETHQDANAFFVVKKKGLGEVEDNLSVSDTGKLETIEGRCVDPSSSSVEANEKILEVNIQGESSNLDRTRDDATQSDRFDGAQSADIFPDSSSSAIRKNLHNIATLDEAFLYEGTDNVIPTHLPADVQAESLGVASPPRQFEADILLEDQILERARSEEDLSSAIGQLLIESPNLSFDENESSPMKITEINEHDAVKIGISGTSGDVVHPTAPGLAESMAGQIMLSSSSYSMDSEMSWDHLVTADKSNLSGGNGVKKLPSADESLTIQSLEAVVPESLVSILNLPSNSDENFEDSHIEECKTLKNRPESSGLSASQVAKESNARKYAAEDIGKDDFGTGLGPDGINSDDSVAFPLNPTHDGPFPGPYVLDLTQSTEFSTPLKMESENEMRSNNVSNDSDSNIPDETLSKQEVRIPKDLNNSDKESDDVVHAEVSGIKDIDEGLLYELDAVGDFRVESEPKWDQKGYGAGPDQFYSVLKGSHPEVQEMPNQLRDTDDSVIPLGLISDAAKFNYSDKVIPVIDELNSVKSQASYSLLPSGEDPEMTLYNSNLHVLEPCPIEEIDSVFQKHHTEAVMHPALDSTVGRPITSTFEKGARELDIATSGQEPSGSDAELLVMDVNSVEDISSALKKHSEDLDKTSIADVEMPEVLPGKTHLEPEVINSDLHVVEARSFEDINVALTQLSEVSIETSNRHVEPEVVDAQSSEASEEHIHPRYVQVEPAEEIQISPVQTAAMQTSMLQRSEKSDGITADMDVSGP